METNPKESWSAYKINDSIILYIKYASLNEAKKHARWTFTFNQKHLEEIRKYQDGDLRFALICIGDKVKGYKPKDVNETTGISLGNLHALEHDKTKPSADALIKPVKLYNATAGWILFGETKGEDGAKNDGLPVPVPNLESAVIFSRIAGVWERGDEETKA